MSSPPAPEKRPLTLTITNNSGVTQSYALFAGEPSITPTPTPIFNDIITTFRAVPGTGGQAFFAMPLSELHTICGTCVREAVQVEIVDRQAVVLGHVSGSGVTVPGTTSCVGVVEGGLQFERGVTLAPTGGPGGFCVRTKTDFSYKEAKAGHYVVGFGTATTPQLVKDIGPIAMFCPAPNTTYQITPSDCFYVAIGRFSPRDPTPEGLEASSCKIDFAQLQSYDVGLVHDEWGKLAVVVNKARL